MGHGLVIVIRPGQTYSLGEGEKFFDAIYMINYWPKCHLRIVASFWGDIQAPDGDINSLRPSDAYMRQ